MPWAVEQQLHHGQDGEHEGRHETKEVQVRRRLQLRRDRGRARVGGSNLITVSHGKTTSMAIPWAVELHGVAGPRRSGDIQSSERRARGSAGPRHQYRAAPDGR